MKVTISRPWLWAFVLLLTPVCGGAAAYGSPAPQQTPPAPVVSGGEQQADQTARVAAEAAAQGGAPVDSKTYKVGTPDVLKIVVWHENDFTGLYTVHSDGQITLPLVGDIQAGGLTLDVITANLEKALAKFIVKPSVTVSVAQVLSKRYFMDGEVNRPGEYPLATPTTVLEAISIAGGLQEFANDKKIIILRGTQRLHFNYKEVIKGKNLDQNIPLESGDHVIVP